eukprot:TRINITY_DN9833_c0_g1_i1.p1 TRINITY_DN9833_c0_g1~~TRINITY_DN9833_c0_g1_i1.p1  ORF type:complete len:295 (+),score=107.32 TRINITY_DN9833_c0_g1_i1:80-886(+)
MADPVTMTARQLKEELVGLGVGTADCLDKADLIDKVRKARANPPQKQAPAPPPRPEGPPAGRSSGGAPSRPGNAKQRAEITRILNTKDYYAVLKVEKTAEQGDVHKAYRKLALLLHPDKCQEPQAEDAFKIVSRAYDTLSKKREQYDLTGDDSDRAGGMNAQQFNADDIFREVFGGGFGRQAGGFQFHNMPGGMHFTFGPGGMQGGRRRRRGAADGPQQQGQAGGSPLAGLSPMMFLFLLPMLPVLLPLLSAFLPYLLLFCLVQTLSR